MLIDGEMLRIRDRERNLLTKLERSKNQLYNCKLRIAHLVCLATRHDNKAWCWHARFGHLSFEALERMAR